MSIQSKLNRIKQASRHGRGAQEALNQYFSQDKVKQLLLESKDLKGSCVVESNKEYNVILSRGRMELYTSDLELVYMRDIRLIESVGKQNHRFVRTWSTESTLTVSLDGGRVKVECQETINDIDEVIENLENLLFNDR